MRWLLTLLTLLIIIPTGCNLVTPTWAEETDSLDGLRHQLASSDTYYVERAIREASGSRELILELMPELTGLLDHEDEFICGAAAKALSRLGPEAAPAVPDLVRQIGTRTSRGGRWSGNALRVIDPGELRRQVETFTAVLRSDRMEAHAAAACALGSLGPVMAVPLAAGLPPEVDECPFMRPAGGISITLSDGFDMEYTDLGPTLDPVSVEAVAALAGVIRDHPDAAVKREAVRSIATYRQHAEAAIPDLLALMDDPDPELVDCVSNTLDQIPIGDTRTVAELLEQIDPGRWLNGMNTLRAIGDRGEDAAEAVPALIEMLNSAGTHPDTYHEVIITLGRIGPPAAPAVPDLIREFDRDYYNSDYLVTQALGRIGPGAEAAIPLLTDAVMTRHYSAINAAEALALIDPDGDLVTHLLMDGLEYNPLLDGNNDSGTARQGCVRALARIEPRTQEITSTLVAALIDPYSSVQVDAANALRHAGANGEQIVPALAGLLSSNGSVAPFYGGLALVENGETDPALIPLIKQELDRRNMLRRPEGCVVMGWLDPDPAVARDCLIKGLDSEGFFQYRNLALLGLLEPRIDAAPAIPRVEEIMAERNPRNWPEAAYVLSQLSPASLEPWIPDLAAELYRDNPEFNILVCYILGECGPIATAALPALETARYSLNYDLQQATVLAIAKIRGE